ncbi:Protein EMSY [Papilio machaon]|uniref:Protein EMSY n=1 Tax=Papilio machaon TaxID=76193 RepID=A0A0N1ID91_PAPMA|nr:Protein EMSY [Papilio machaon]
MWPMLLNMTREECRQTLRRLELEAYSKMMSVLRAQGALEENRKKLLEELRAVLHIGNDRHSAEARRVSNDELLATIADQLAGPNTGIGWICEGRRRIPLLPRSIPQTAYTEIADKAADAAVAENKELQKKLEAEKLIAPKSSEEQHPDPESQTAEGASTNEDMDELFHPPIAMEDETLKMWETELICRKRKVPEGGAIPEEGTTPVKNMRNIQTNANQKHVNLSQIYSKYSQPASSKSSSQSKHSYNQVSKVSTSKSNQPNTSRSSHKHRSHKQNAKSTHAKSNQRKSQDLPMSPNKQYNSNALQSDYNVTPNSFQASYAQTVLSNKTKSEYVDEIKPKVLSSPGMVTDSPTMQLLTQPATVPHELGVSDNVHPDDPATLQAQSTPVSKTTSGKPCHLIIKKRGDTTTDKVQMSEFKILQNASEGVKVLSNRQVVVAPTSTQKALNSGKLVTTKVIGSAAKPRTPNTAVPTDKMIVVSKPTMENKIMTNSKIILTSSVQSTPNKEPSMVAVSANNISKPSETFTPKGIPATDLKVSAKTFVLNPKSGHKMVVVPAKSRTNQIGEVPLLHFKGIPTGMKFVAVSSQSNSQVNKSTAMTVVSKAGVNIVNTIPSNAKILGVEPIKTANLADIVPVKGLAPVSTPKISNPIVRPTVTTKGNVIVVQKGSAIGKAITFTKNGNDVSKIIMGKNVNQLLQATKPDQVDVEKCPGNVIVLELNNEQTARPTTMSEILDSRSSTPRASDHFKKVTPQITQDTPVLFESQITEESCNPNSLDSSAESIGDIVPLEQTDSPTMHKDESKDFEKGTERVKEATRVADWEMELETASKDKDEDDKLNSLHLDLGMSSDSEGEYMVEPRKGKSKRGAPETSRRPTPSGEGHELYIGSGTLSLATRTLLSQLQEEGSSSNDSSFALRSKLDKAKDCDIKLDKSESDALTKAKEKLSEKVAESQQKRIDIYSTAITSSEINLDSFSYLDEGMLVGDDVFSSAEGKRERRGDALDDQLSRLLADDSANSTDSQTVSESLPSNKP